MSTTPSSFGLTKVKAESMKPAQEELDLTGGEDHKYFVVYVAGGKETRAACSQQLWKKVLGPKAQPGRKLPGYDNKVHHNFYIITDPKTGNVVDVDLLPENKYQRGAVPEVQEELHTMDILINPSSGQIEIAVLPPKVLDTKIRSIMDAIDKLDKIEPGQEIDGCEVIAVAGNRIQLDIPQG